MPPRREAEAGTRERPRSFAKDAPLARYRIEVGRNQGASPKEIVGAIANEGGIDGRHIGQIHLFDDYSTVELPANLPPDLLDILKRTRVRSQPLRIRPATAAEAEAAFRPRQKPTTAARPPRPADPAWREPREPRQTRERRPPAKSAAKPVTKERFKKH